VIVVPTASPASELQSVITLAAGLRVPLLALCSGPARVDDVLPLIERTDGAQGIAVQVPDGYVLEQAPRRTSAPRLLEPSGGRASDLSVKRNLGVLFARKSARRKVLFLDDDIVTVPRETICRLETQLDLHNVAGMRCREFPDNSVVCHARRQAGQWQDNFVSGAALGVNCSDHPLGFFPDIYNEDWFFLSPIALKRRLPFVGEARQAPYDPFRRPERARHEEFGDLIAEGLYALFGEHPDHDLARHVDDADEAYWSRFIDVRAQMIEETMTKLARRSEHDAVAGRAHESLRSAHGQLRLIKADVCAEYVSEWLHDNKQWEDTAASVNSVGRPADIFPELGLTIWGAAGRSREFVAG
jgi:hypothetical protein